MSLDNASKKYLGAFNLLSWSLFSVAQVIGQLPEPIQIIFQSP
ncbi:MAG: hypothetical protein BAJATHORv1_30520 [Candidatus Thorarchaeota archaeon]|nr:MAG: hypothetical protein BAJATHORv1_30520 [Candidatus Thorarchaeota archaeon]